MRVLLAVLGCLSILIGFAALVVTLYAAFDISGYEQITATCTSSGPTMTCRWSDGANDDDFVTMVVGAVAGAAMMITGGTFVAGSAAMGRRAERAVAPAGFAPAPIEQARVVPTSGQRAPHQAPSGPPRQ